MMEKRYTSLRIIGTIFKILGIIGFVITLLSVLGAMGVSVIGGAVTDSINSDVQIYTGVPAVFGGIVGGLMLSFVILLSGALSSLITYATGAAIYLLIDMEQNTRSVALQIQELVPRPVRPPVETLPAPAAPE